MSRQEFCKYYRIYRAWKKQSHYTTIPASMRNWTDLEMSDFFAQYYPDIVRVYAANNSTLHAALTDDIVLIQRRLQAFKQILWRVQHGMDHRSNLYCSLDSWFDGTILSYFG